MSDKDLRDEFFGLAENIFVPKEAKDSKGSKITFDYEELEKALTDLLKQSNQTLLDELEGKAVATHISDGKGGVEFAVPLESIKAMKENL